MHFIIGTDLEINSSFSEPAFQPPHVQLANALTLSSSPSWPFSTALFNTHKSHTDCHWMLGKGIDRDIWLLVDNMHNWGVRKQVISLVEVCETKTPTLVLCAHCCGSRPLFEHLTLIIQSCWTTHYKNPVLWPYFIQHECCSLAHKTAAILQSISSFGEFFVVLSKGYVILRSCYHTLHFLSLWRDAMWIFLMLQRFRNDWL